MQRDSPIDGAKLASWRREAMAEAIAAGVPPAELDWLLQEFAGLDKLSLRTESLGASHICVAARTLKGPAT